MFKNKNITVKGIETSYIDEGDAKETLLLIHGFSFKVGLIPLVKELGKKARVLAPDLTGFGLSKDANFSCTTENYVHFLKDFLNRLDIKKVSVFGNSMGGSLALKFAAAYPEKVDKVIVRSPLFTAKQLPWQYRNKPMLFTLKTLSKNEVLLNLLKNIFFYNFAKLASKNAVDKKVYNEIRRQQENNLSAKTAKEILFDLTEIDITDMLPKIDKQTLILWGGKDEMLKSSYAATISRLLPNATVKIQSDESHLIVTLDSKALSQEIVEFINTK